jgi:hexokinase
MEKPGTRHSAYIGFILGTGTNVAYVERNANIGKISVADRDGAMVVNTESGGFSKIEQSAFDRAMDAKTHDAGAQTFEKMIAGAYLGRVGLEIFKAAARNGFFTPEASRGILSLGNLASYDLDNFCANHKTEQPNPLDRIFAADADRSVARRLATPVFERAAILTAIHLAAFILQTGGGTDPSAPVCVCIDGSTYYKTRTVSFPKIVQAELDAMLGPRNIAFELTVCPDDAPMVGAAVAVLLKKDL